jgi:hypothetical protein
MEFEKHEAGGCGPCSLLAADIQVHREVVEQGLLDGERREFMAARGRALESLRQAAGASGARRPRLPHIWLLGAAAAAVVCIFLLAWPFLRRPVEPVVVTLPTGGDIIMEAMPFSAPPVLRGEESPVDLWSKAEEAYVNGRFRKAARHLRAIEEQQPGHADTSLYLGISLLMTGRPAEARTELATARKRAAALELPQSAAAWFEALAALAEGDRAGARRALEAAAEEGGLYAERARELLATWSSEP